MDTVVAGTTTHHANIKTTTELLRPLANFPPSIWGDRFLLFSLDSHELDAYVKGMEKPKEELKRLIINPTADSNAKLSLIYSVYRLGLTYLFKEEIDGQLGKLFDEINLQDYHQIDLHTISIHFQVFRVHGYHMSCDVFTKFMDSSTGSFKKEINTDVKGMLSFYESAQLRIRGESILDDAYAFTKAQLNGIDLKMLEGSLAQQVYHILRGPVHRGIQLAEARLYLLNYEKECSTHGSLLKFAKTHFKYLQLLQKEELCIVSRWWKDMDFVTKTPYVRDRVPEFYLWMSAMFLEPYYSQVRIITTKIVILLCVLDDTCDAYATIEEFRLLTHAINRWESTAMDQLPEYIKSFYEILLNEYEGLEKQQAKEGSKVNRVNLSKQAFQEMARAYLQEAEWRESGEVPSFEDYMKTGLTTSGYDLIPKTAMIGMGEIVTEEALEWYQSHPKILRASQLISRLHGDVMTYEFERERAISATSIDAYMKTFGVSEKDAVNEIMKMVENAWKDINEGYLKPTDAHAPIDLVAPIVNLTRMIDVVYRLNDGLTFPEETLKEYITLLFEDPIPM